MKSLRIQIPKIWVLWILTIGGLIHSTIALCLDLQEGSMQTTKKWISIDEAKGPARDNYEIAFTFFNQGYYDSALYYFNRAEEAPTDNWDLRYNILSGRGWLNNILGYYDDARKDLLEVYRMTLDENGRRDTAYDHNYYYTAINKLGTTYDNLGRFDSAIVIYKLAVDSIYDGMPGTVTAHIMGNLALVYANLGDFENALKYDQKSLELELVYGYPSSIMATLFNISYDYYDLGMLDSALIYNDQALFVYDTARRHTEGTGSGLEMASEFERHWKGAVSLRVQILRDLGRSDEALDLMIGYHDRKDSLEQVNRTELVKELEAKYQNQKKEAENARLVLERQLDQATINQQQTWIIIVMVFLIVVIILFVIQYRSRQLVSKQKLQIEEQSEKLKALDQFKSRFFANVSHDLRTPLLLMQGNIQKIQNSDSYLDDQSQVSLEKLKVNTDKLTHLTDEIRDLILLEENRLILQYQPVQLGDFLKRLVGLFHSAAEMKQVSLTYQAEVDSPVVHLDPNQFEKVIYNLIANALRFTDPQGHISVTLLKGSGESVRILVEDDGAGIPGNKINYIFNRFYQASDQVSGVDEGLGIGLALVMEIIELHGGRIRVDSVEHEGTRFEIDLPMNLNKPVSKKDSVVESRKPYVYLDEDTTTQMRVDIKENEKVRKSSETVLIVDDHPEIRAYLKELIEDDYIIRMASDGREALELLKKGKVDLVITDLMMPWMDGHQLIEKMKSDDQLKAIPVLVVSARTTGEDLMKVLESGVSEFIAKPFSVQELKQRIKNALDKSAGKPNLWDELSADKNKRSDVERNMISRVNALILDKIDDPSFSVADIADAMTTSTRNVYNLMQKLTDKNPKDYIRFVRFQYVEDLMKKKKVRSVSEAAQSIGMLNATHFSRQFEKVMGVHPATFFDQKQSI